jgi:hypothetical protein
MLFVKTVAQKKNLKLNQILNNEKPGGKMVIHQGTLNLLI